MFDRSAAVELLGSERASRIESRMIRILSQIWDPSSQFTAPSPSYGLEPPLDIPKLSDDFDDSEISHFTNELSYNFEDFPFDFTGKPNRLKEPKSMCIGSVPSRYICIWSGGVDSIKEELPGFIWVAVHGINTICVATRTKDLEHEFNLRKTVYGEEPAISLPIITNGIIGKVEDFVDPSKLPPSSLHQIKKPFAVVSLFPGVKIVPLRNGVEAVCSKYDDENAMKFLQDEMESGAVFTYDKTVQTAACALKHLFHNELEASEIKGFVWKEKDGGEAKALTLLDTKEILAAMNNNRGSSVGEGHLGKEILEIEEQLAAMKKPAN